MTFFKKNTLFRLIKTTKKREYFYVFKKHDNIIRILINKIYKKNFEVLGRTVGKAGKTIFRLLKPAKEYYEALLQLSIKKFENAQELILIIDDTLIRKIYSKLMEGSGCFYDTQLFRRITAYKLLVAMLTDGFHALPLTATFLFSNELVPNAKQTKFEWIKKIIVLVQKQFPNKRIIICADGAFASKDFLRWCVENNIAVEVRMRSNCVVQYKEKVDCIRNIKTLTPKGRQMARTIEVIWHGIPLFITAQRRIDKNNNETIVFQAATFKVKSSRHVEIYRTRWNIEKMFRTTKQHLGLQECSSRKMETQESHIASVFLAYALVHCDQRQQNLPTPEAALRASERKKGKFLDRHLERLGRFIHDVYA